MSTQHMEKTFVAAIFFAGGTDGNEPAEHPYLVQCFLQINDQAFLFLFRRLTFWDVEDGTDSAADFFVAMD